MQWIESKKNPRVKEWKKLQTKKGRDRSGCFLIEGYHLVEEALDAGVTLTEVIVQGKADLPLEWNLDDLAIYEVTTSVMKDISETEHPQGVAAVCRKRELSLPEDLKGQYLLVDAVQDPGNVGTMIRTADAAGLKGIVLGEGCTDPYNGKVLRATQGSLFHLPVVEGDLYQWVDELKRQQVCVFSTALEDGQTYTSIQAPDHFALIVGNEAGGVDPTLLDKSDQQLTIPIEGKAESLNVSVATGILLYGLK